MNLIVYHSTLPIMPVWDSAVFQPLFCFFHPFEALFVIFFFLYHVVVLQKFSFSFPFFFSRPAIPKDIEEIKYCLGSNCNTSLYGI